MLAATIPAGLRIRAGLLAPTGAPADGERLRPAAPELLLSELNSAGELDWSHACMDASHVRAKRGRRDGPVASRPPQDRQQTPPDLRRQRHPAQGHHYRSERQRRHPDPDPRRRRPARRRPRRPSPQAPRSPARRQGLRQRTQPPRTAQRGILPAISRRDHPDVHGLGKLRYVVEQASALPHQFKRLTVHWERRHDLHNAFVSLS